MLTFQNRDYFKSPTVFNFLAQDESKHQPFCENYDMVAAAKVGNFKNPGEEAVISLRIRC